MNVAVGSNSRVKIDAVQEAFQAVFPNEEIEVDGYQVPSGVSDQPMSDEESNQGAIQLGRQALQSDNPQHYFVSPGSALLVEKLVRPQFDIVDDARG